MRTSYFLILGCLLYFSPLFWRGAGGEAFAQPRTLDGIIAVVGGSPILQSELDAKRVQARRDSIPFDKCAALEDILYQKLLFAQAIKDSVEITDDQVEDELDRRLRQYIPQFGSIKAFEDFVGKSIEQYKAEVREDLREVLLGNRMQGRITDDITISPAEVKAYFESFPKDSVPLVNAEIEVGHIVKKPLISAELKKYAKEKLEEIRKDIISGKIDFGTAAIMHTMDPGSKDTRGCYKSIQRGTFVPEFDAIAFRIKEGEVSEVFETSFGFHILKVLARRGDEVDVCHILIAPEPAAEDLGKAKLFLDSIADLIRKDSITFEQAASRFSDDEDTKQHGGLLFNPSSGTTRFEMDQLGQIDQFLVFTTDKLKAGEISDPSLTQTRDGMAYHIVYVKSRTEPHRANLKDDYQRIQDEALVEKKQDAVNAWIKKKVTSMYVRVSDEYKTCKFENPWVN